MPPNGISRANIINNKRKKRKKLKKRISTVCGRHHQLSRLFKKKKNAFHVVRNSFSSSLKIKYGVLWDRKYKG